MIRQLAAVIRRFPSIIRIPYWFFRRLQTRYTIGVVGVILDQRGGVLVVEHVLHPDIPWGLPGGWIGADEDPAAAVARELKEELQLAVKVIRVLHIRKSFPNHIDMSFLCETQSAVGKLSCELLDHSWLAPDDLPDLHCFHRESIDIALNCGRNGS